MKKIILPFFLLFFVAATAQVVYTDINPDVVLAATTQSQSMQYDLDLNNDGTIDFNIKHNDYGGFKQAEFYTNFGQQGEILSNGSGGALALNLNANINPTLTNWVCTASSSGNSALFMNANGAVFPGQQDKFVGLRIKLSGQWHYGWVRLNIPSDTASIIVKDYGYGTAANASVTAGQVATSLDALTETAAISVFPNPAINNLVITLPQGEWGDAEITLLNLGGQVMLSQPVAGNLVRLDVSPLPEGFYLVGLAKNGLMLSPAKPLVKIGN